MCDTMLSIHIYEVFLHHLSYSQCFAENYSVTLSFSFEYSQWQETYHLLSQLILFGKSSPLESASWKLAQICCCSVAQSCLTLCSPMDCSMLGFPVLHYLPEFAKTHVHWVGDAIQPSHPPSPSSPPALNLTQHQGLFQWVSSFQQVAKVLQF